jgi:cytochrome c oxidase accessory protein FixG
MELVFRRIEYWIEGDAYRQKQLDRQPWNAGKVMKKGLKHAIFFLIAFAVGNTFLAYIIGIDALKEIVTDNPRDHLAGLGGMLVFAGLFYFIFSWFREQVCTIVCPYGRLQGVLLDRQSVVISYDYNRGEPRGTFFKGEDRAKAGKGQCINCTQCVQVCPTGIDIRNGTQLECINCACCIDACNHMMDSTGQRRGLIRYASEAMVAERKKWKLGVRPAAYSAVLLILLGVITWSFTSRAPLEATVLRTPGMLFQEPEPGIISNLYNIKLVNKTNEDLPVEIRLVSPQGTIRLVTDQVTAKKQSLAESVFFILLRKDSLTSDKVPVTVAIYGGGQLIEEIRSTFVGPAR